MNGKHTEKMTNPIKKLSFFYYYYLDKGSGVKSMIINIKCPTETGV